MGVAEVEALFLLLQSVTLLPTAAQARLQPNQRRLQTMDSPLKHPTQAQATLAPALATQVQAQASHHLEASSPRAQAVHRRRSSHLPFQSRQAHHQQEALLLLHHHRLAVPLAARPVATKVNAAQVKSHAQHQASTASAPHNSACATGVAQLLKTCRQALSAVQVLSRRLLSHHSDEGDQHDTFTLLSMSI